MFVHDQKSFYSEMKRLKFKKIFGKITAHGDIDLSRSVRVYICLKPLAIREQLSHIFPDRTVFKQIFNLPNFIGNFPRKKNLIKSNQTCLSINFQF
jgi:hypothetical protein